MAQNDYNIPNQSFPSFRSDLNDALSAINSSNSGTSRPSSAVAGTIWLDTSGGVTANVLKFYDGGADISLATINTTANTVDWIDSTVVSDLVNDTTPQLGGQLDVNGNAIGDGTLELLKFIETASAVNEVTVTNAATSNAPQISATGDDTNIDLKLTPKGSGKLNLDGIKFPNADGSENQILQTNGSGVLSFVDASSGGIDWVSTVVTGATQTVEANKGYWIDTTSNACTVTFPGSASVGDQIILVDYARNWETNAVTINQNSLNFQGNSSNNPIFNTTGQAVNVVYSGSTKGWIPISDDDVLDKTVARYDISYLNVAGGAGGGRGKGAGGGAGGLQTGTLSQVAAGTVITVVVGGGGSQSSNASNRGGTGANSTISGAGFTTVTSLGGGGGGSDTSAAKPGEDGGSGGGGSDGAVGGSGTSGQGKDGGTGHSGATAAGGGGGGANAVGGNGSSNVGGAGGAGTASSITGSSVTYAGGGGGCNESQSQGSGGAGGGGAGGQNNGTNASANLGAGGGGCHNGTSGGGGSGVVILSVPTSSYSGTVSGSPTVTTSGSNKIIQFNGDGTYTA